MLTRREFVARVGGTAAGAVVVPRILAAKADIHFGYAAITWQGNDRQAIEDVAAVGFTGIQLRSNILPEFGDKPAALRELLAKHGLTMVAFSSGNMRIDPSVEKEELEKHTRHARFVRDVGGLYLQLTDERPKDRAVTAADYKRMGGLLTELGKRTADLGIPLGYHNHMNNLGERPEEVRAVLDSADPRYVKLELDTAHYQQGGGDPVRAVKEYRDRLLFLHIKDLQSPAPGASGDLSRSYRFVELGRGKVNLKGVFAALEEISFKGWAVVELDRVPDDARTPKESAEIARKYVEGLGYRMSRSVQENDAALPNQLTDAERRAGWSLLFDGRTLDGWRGYNRADAAATRWKTEGGLLTVDPADGNDTRGALDLITQETFDSFELSVEWRISPGGNSGIKYFVLEDRDAAIGHEFQIIDDERHPDAKVGPKRQTAAFYDVLAAGNRPLRPAGSFNIARVVVHGGHVEHWLNGTRVLQYELGSPALQAAIEGSKFKGIERFGKPQKGHILLQDHGDRVWYRNVKIRRIT
jgi:inosose dehydratase